MLPDFPQAKKQVQKTINAYLRKQVKQNAPMYALLNPKQIYEGDRLGVINRKGEHIVNKMNRVESKINISNEEAKTINSSGLASKITDAAKDMANQIERGLITKMTDAIKETGNNIAGNPSLNPDSLLDTKERMPMSFEDDDINKPISNCLFASEEAIAQLEKAHEESTEEDARARKERDERIIEKKYKEHMNDLNSRKITK